MIKRRFYRVEHGEGDAPSSASSSSSSSSSSDGEEAEKEEREMDEDDKGREDSSEEEGGADEKVSGDPEESGPQSGYESEESSGNEIDCNHSGVMNEEQDNAASIVDEESDKAFTGASQIVPMTLASSHSTTNPSQPELLDRVIKLKSVFKCKLCPRIICLCEETMRTHLKSKRHGRSEKLFKEGRLKFMLNDDGEIVEETETHAERHARTVVTAQNAANQKNMKNRGRQRQRIRKKKFMKKGLQEVKEKTKAASGKKRQKIGD